MATKSVSGIKATEVATKEEIKASAIERYKPIIEKAKGKLSKANVDKLKAGIEIGKAFIALKSVFTNKKELGEWSEENVGIKVAQAYNFIALADEKNKEVIDQAIKDEVGPTEANKRIRDANKAKSGKATTEKPAPAFDYGIKRNDSSKAKPGEGSAEEIADQLYEAIDSILTGNDKESEIIEYLLQNLEERIPTPAKDEAIAQ